MAYQQRRPYYRSATNGSAAYDLNYVAGAVAVPAPEYAPSRRPVPEQAPYAQPYTRPRTRPEAEPRVRERTRVQVREQQKVAPFALCGCVAVIVMAVVLLMGYVQLNEVYADTVTLQGQLTDLQAEGSALEARYEEVFDAETLAAAVAADGTLTQPTEGQRFYIDLSREDNAVVYETSDSRESAGSIADTGRVVVSAAVEYFR